MKNRKDFRQNEGCLTTQGNQGFHLSPPLCPSKRLPLQLGGSLWPTRPPLRRSPAPRSLHSRHHAENGNKKPFVGEPTASPTVYFWETPLPRLREGMIAEWRLLWLLLGEPLFCLLGKRVRETGSQCPLERCAALCVLLGLQLRHSEIIKVFRGQRLFPCAFLE
jgi:hypothetical protein